MAITEATKVADCIQYVEDGQTKVKSITGTHIVISFPNDGYNEVVNIYVDPLTEVLTVDYDGGTFDLDPNTANHAASHTDGTDDIQNATAAQKGLATAAQITKLDGVATGADVTGDNAPQAHKTSHENDGADEVSVAGLSGLLADDQHVLDAEAVSAMGAKADNNPLNHDRYTDAEAVTAAKTVKLDDFTAPDDNTDLNSSTSAHGLLKKLDNVATNFMNGQGNWAAPAGGGAVATDVIWDAKGDLALGTGADTAQKLTVGANNTVIVADSGETTGLKYQTMPQLWALLSGDAAAAVDMNGQFFSDMPIENGATVPASPRTGELFYHTPTGRYILMIYNGSSWVPLISAGTMTVYVDDTDGTDSMDKGGAADAGAFKSVQYAVDQIPGLIGGNVVINVNAEAYAETVTIQGKMPIGNYTITFSGTLSSQETATCDSKTTGAGATQGTLTDTGAFTGDSYEDLLVYIATAAEYLLIDSHTDDVLTIVDVFADTTNKVWTVYDWGTTISKILIEEGQLAVVVEDIKFDGGTTTDVHVNKGGTLTLTRSRVVGGVYVDEGWCRLNVSCANIATLTRVIQFMNGGHLILYQSKVVNPKNAISGAAVRGYNNALLECANGTVIECYDNTKGRGIQLEYGAVALMWTNTTTHCTTRLRNCDYGFYSEAGVAIRNAATDDDVTYEGSVGDDHFEVADTFCYIDY